jgi:hypothetical protein
MAFIALVVPLVLLPCAGFAIEASHLTARHARLQEIALTAAEDGAQQIDVNSLRAGNGLTLDTTQAPQVATAAALAQDPGATVTTSVAGQSITVTISETTPLQLAAFLGVRNVTISASVTTHIAAGFDAPG